MVGCDTISVVCSKLSFGLSVFTSGLSHDFADVMHAQININAGYL